MILSSPETGVNLIQDGTGIRYQTQIGNAITSRQVRYICHPDLFWAGIDYLFRAGFKQIGMSAEAMMAVGRLVVGPFSADQLAAFTQNQEQTIPANMELLVLTLRMHHRMQLPSADAGLAGTDLLYKCYELLVLVGPSPVDPVAFVIGLTANPHKLASPADTQGLGLRNDLPGRFFTTDTP